MTNNSLYSRKLQYFLIKNTPNIFDYQSILAV